MFTEKLIRAMQSGQGIDEVVREASAPMRFAIQQLLKQVPFEPFRISLTSRSHVDILHPKQVALDDGTATISELDADGQWQMRQIISLMHVVSLQDLPADKPVVVGDAKESPGRGANS